MNSLSDIFKNLRTTEQMDNLLGNTRETADILSTEQDDSSYFRLSVLDTVENIMSEISQYGGEVRDILNGIQIATNLMPELLDELQVQDRSLMLEYLDLIETNTRALATHRNEDDIKMLAPPQSEDDSIPVSANEISSIMDAVAVSLTDSLDKQATLLGELVSNSNFQRDLVERDQDGHLPTTIAEDEDEAEDNKEGGGVLGFLGGIMGAWKKLPRGVQMLGRGLKTAGIVVGTAMFVKDLYDTFNDTERLRDITGRAEGALTAAEHSAGTIAGALETFTGGLLDTKSSYELIHTGVDAIQKVMDELYDPEEGLFGGFVQSLFNVIETADWAQFGSDIMDSIMDFPNKLVDKVSQWWSSFAENILGKDITDGVKSVTDFATNRLSDFSDWAVGGGKELLGLNDSSSQDASAVVQKMGNSEASNGPRTVQSISSQPLNRTQSSRTEQVSKERFEDMLKSKEAPQVSTPVVQNMSTTNYSPIIREDSLGKQIQLLGI